MQGGKGPCQAVENITQEQAAQERRTKHDVKEDVSDEALRECGAGPSGTGSTSWEDEFLARQAPSGAASSSSAWAAEFLSEQPLRPEAFFGGPSPWAGIQYTGHGPLPPQLLDGAARTGLAGVPHPGASSPLSKADIWLREFHSRAMDGAKGLSRSSLAEVHGAKGRPPGANWAAEFEALQQEAVGTAWMEQFFEVTLPRDRQGRTEGGGPTIRGEFWLGFAIEH